PDASSEESGSAGEEQEVEAPAPEAPPKDAEEPAAKETKKDAVKEKVKKIKRTIPSWATMSASRRALAQKSSVSLYNQPKMDDILIEAIQACKDKASTHAIMKYIMKNYAALELDRRTFLLKKALKRLLEKKAIKQLKGKGFSGSFMICKQSQKDRKAPASKAAPQGKTETLGDTLPLIMTRLCEPKEASYILIKKYLEQHFPQLNVEQRPDLLKSALQRAVDKGHLEQITGKGASGTFQIKRVGDKALLKGGLLEDAILTAITAMNEPKTCSITILRKFLLEKHKDSRVSLLVNNLKRTLKTCKMRGWMEQITGNGFNGTYQLCYPFYPSPALLFPEKQKEKEKPKRRNERKEESSDEEESEEEEDDDDDDEEEEESEDEPPAKKRKQQKRPPSKVRRPPPAKKTWRGSGSRNRGGAQKAKEPARSSAKGKKMAPPKKQSASAKRPVPPAKKPAASSKRAAPPAKRPVPPAKKPASAAKTSSSKKAPPPSKTPASKKAASEAKPKTPVTKKMTSRAPKRLAPKRPAPKAAAPKSAVKAKPGARKSQRSRK
ncbi:hypothetical protein JZ751_028323, partial [Albula glossodonta]